MDQPKESAQSPAHRLPDAVDSVRVLAVVILGVVGLMAAAPKALWAQVAAVEVPFLLGPLLYVFGLRLAPGPSLGVRLPGARTLVLVVLASLSSMWLLNGLVIVQEWLLVRAGHGRYVEHVHQQLEKPIIEVLLRQPGTAFALFSLAPALCEEFLFRGVVFRGFVRSFTPARGVLYTALLFAAVHVEPLKMLPMFALGLFFAALALWTRSIWSSVIAHAANNAAVLFVAKLSHDLSAPVGEEGPWSVYVLSAAVFVPAMALLWGDYREAESR
ncbi:MAG: CPBP family intramembrane metalloprotease [Planctomycetes bacterium]|nr:CPBP family intramembrane metalloprotease [Planctomycetota bacterium]